MQKNKWMRLSLIVFVMVAIIGSISTYAEEELPQDPPTLVSGDADVMIENNNGRLNDTTLEMEYKLAESSDEYKRAGDYYTWNLKPGNYLVRYAPKTGYAASLPVVVNVPWYVNKKVEFNGEGTEMKVVLSMPIKDIEKEEVLLFGIDGLKIEDYTLDVDEDGKTYYIKKKFIPNTIYVFNIQKEGYAFDNEEIYPTQGFTQSPPENLKGMSSTTEADNDGFISGVAENMEYKLASADESAYVKVTGTVIGNLKSGEYDVRYAAIYDEIDNAIVNYKASEPVKVIVPKCIKVEKNILSGSKSGFEIKLTPAVAGIELNDFVIDETENVGVNINVMSATSTDGGTTYTVLAPLENGKKYTINLNRIGYSFGDPIVLDLTSQMQEEPKGLVGVAPTNKDNTNGSIEGLTNAMEYALVTEDQWKNVNDTGNQNLVPGTYKVRYAAKLGFVESPEVTVVIPVYVQIEACSINDTGTEMIFGLSTSVKGMTAEQILLSKNGNPIAIESVIEQNAGQSYKIVAKFQANGTYVLELSKLGYAFEAGKNIIAGKFTQPTPSDLKGTAPTTEANNDGAITGVTELMEYKLSTADDSAAVKVSGTTISGLASGTYCVRFSGTESLQPSSWVEVIVPITVKVEKAISNASKSGFAIQFSSEVPNLGVVDFVLFDTVNPENKITARSVTTSDYGKSYVVLAPFEDGKIYSINIIKEGYLFGEPASMDLTNQTQEAPKNLYSTPPTSKENKDGGIVGVTEEMEYASTTDLNWIPVKANGVTDLTPGSYKVRYSQKLGFVASPEVTIVVSTYSEIEAVTVNEFGTELMLKLSNHVSGLKTNDISLIVGSDVQTISSVQDLDGGLTYKLVVNLQPNTKCILGIEKEDYAFNGDKNFETHEFEQLSPKDLIGTAPTSEDNNNGVISGVTENMEYKLKEAEFYIKVPHGGMTGLASGTYCIRYAEVEGYKASNPVEIIVPAYIMPGIVTFTKEPVDMVLEVKNKEGQILVAEENGTYKLKPGDYTYNASKVGYISQIDKPFSVAEKEQKNLSVILESEAPELNILTEVSKANHPDLRIVDYEDATGTIYKTIRGVNVLNETGKKFMTYFEVKQGNVKVSRLVNGKYVEMDLNKDITNFVGTRTKITLYNNKGKEAQSYYVIIKGDVNYDGRISSIDANVLAKHNARTGMITDALMYNAGDVSDDNKLSAQDQSFIVRHITGYKKIEQ